MNPVKFPESNVVYGQFQKEYKPLPAMRVDGPAGDVITCWNLSLFERLKVLFSGEVWVSQLTFHAPIQPQMLTAEKSDVIHPKGVRSVSYGGKYVCTRMRVRVQEGYLVIYDRYTLEYKLKILGFYFWVTGEELLHVPIEGEEVFAPEVFGRLITKRIENSLKRSAERRKRSVFGWR